ncbi:ANM_HP_G0259450.mRNA.1.CDS.1 [Saccharomyces cerevisiae]|nr:ANM_HP_G0259450.mRNA.1.CDS.1 [Saccharomyces cerevisiae]CAI6792461.1 ANM_collapsed_G0035390.mRNA.1.CDS.1 [Saccharomyces cerevisiae]CAI7011515.1 ANM_HP_G0259450.mRNA.1.CDS.1 [Saccharomyces cerevisiae]
MSNESNDLEKNISHLDPTGVDNAYIPPEQPETKHSRFNIDRDTLRNHFTAAVGVSFAVPSCFYGVLTSFVMSLTMMWL